MNTYDNEKIIRTETIDGETNWHWYKNDVVAWELPKRDWVNSHREKFLKYLTGTKAVVTAGGNQGLYTRLYSNIFDFVYSFEPDAKNFHYLVLNNQKDNVFKFNCALGDKPESVMMHRPHDTNTGMHYIVPKKGVIPQITLDSFHFEELNLLQLDVENYELRALVGAQQTIIKHKPVIALENGETQPIKELMSHLGYSLVDRSAEDTIYMFNK